MFGSVGSEFEQKQTLNESNEYHVWTHFDRGWDEFVVEILFNQGGSNIMCCAV